jgi:hypothetical protein
MRQSDRARGTALTVLAAVAGTASVGIAALAREGVCLHRLGVFGLQSTEPMPGMSMAPGMAMDATASAPCPILFGAALVAGALYLIALGAILVLRPRPAELALASARLILGVRFAPMAAALAALGAVPLGAALMMDGAAGAAPYVAAAFLVACAVLCAGALIGVAKLVLSFAHRFVVALLAAPRWLTPGGDDAPWLDRRVLVPMPAGARLVRRRPSRAPPLR